MRFPGFVGEWDITRLREIADFSKGKGISKSEVDENGITECIRYGELYTIYGEVISEIKSKTNVPTENLVLSEANDVIIPASGETQIDIATASCVQKSGVALGGDLNIIKTSNNGIFLSYYLNSKRKMEIARLAQGISVVHLYSSQLASLEIHLPGLEEQSIVASFFSILSERISTQNKIIAQLESLMRCLREKLFKQQIQFNDETGNEFPSWVWERLGNLCKTVKSGGTPQSTRREYYDGPIPFLSISDMTSQGKYLTSTVNSISQLGLDNSSSWVVPVHSIIYSMYASVGFVSINNIPLATSQAVLNLILKPNIETEFVYYYLVEFQKRISKFITTGTQANLNAETVKGFEIPIPVIEEQILIAKFLTSIDEKIKIEERISKNYEQQKKYLLQNLFI